jgi:hypothetical protein
MIIITGELIFFSLPRLSPHLEKALLGPHHSSSGKMMDRHMTRKHGLQAGLLHHAGGGFRLINLTKRLQTQPGR